MMVVTIGGDPSETLRRSADHVTFHAGGEGDLEVLTVLGMVVSTPLKNRFVNQATRENIPKY